MAGNFTIEGRAKSLPDIQKTFLWELNIPNIADLTNKAIDVENLEVRCRSVSIPNRGNDPIVSNFMGMQQFFPGKPTFSHTLSVAFEETEDQMITKALYEWQQRIFNTEPGITGGISSVVSKRGVGGAAGLAAPNMYLLMYKYNGELLDKKITFVNAWIQSVDDVGLDYTDNAAVRYTATFQYDYWKLEDN